MADEGVLVDDAVDIAPVVGESVQEPIAAVVVDLREHGGQRGDSALARQGLVVLPLRSAPSYEIRCPKWTHMVLHSVVAHSTPVHLP